MFIKIFGILQGSREYQGWGCNALTVSFVANMLFLIVRLYATSKQADTIAEKRSGDSVSVSFFTYSVFFSFSFLLYGLSINSLYTVLCTVLAIPCLRVIWGLWRFKGFTSKEKVLSCVFCLMVPAMIFLPWKPQMLFLFSIGSISILIVQAWELWRAKKVGALDIRMIMGNLIATVFLTIYAFAVGELVLKAINILFLVILIIIAMLWFKYKNIESKTAYV